MYVCNNAKNWHAVKNEWNSFKRFDVPKLSHVVCKMLSQHYTIITVKCVVMYHNTYQVVGKDMYLSILRLKKLENGKISCR